MEKHLQSLSTDVGDIFADSSENDRTFNGFSDSEISDVSEDTHNSDKDDADVKRLVSKRPSHRFSIRVALRTAKKDEGEHGDVDEFYGEMTDKLDEGGQTFAMLLPECDSDSEDDNFLDKRASNIKANKTLLAHLMADLCKMPGALWKTQQSGHQKEPRSRPPRAPAPVGKLRRNPERASRRLTRSMGGCRDTTTAQEEEEEEEELELSLEEELLKVRRAPNRHGKPRPNHGKPHIVRPVEDITKDELSLVADGITDKAYNSVTGNTCHQCRQKTVDTKTCCRSPECRGIQGQFCGPCLRNRYGEDVRKALLDPEWRCPPCRGICNCSFCRQRDGRCPTGILFPLARYNGFSDVHSYLNSKTKTEEDV